MTANFACVYGISNPTPGIVEGDCFSVYRPGASILGFTGKGGVVFWFVFEDLGRPWPLSEVPRYSEADADPVCQSVAHLKLDNGLRFADIYANRTVARKVVLEEGMAKTWHSARAVLVGDAAHKVFMAGHIYYGCKLTRAYRWSRTPPWAPTRRWSRLSF
jgi:FAD dependent monooxygenase